MSRTVTWRRTCSAELSSRIDESLQLTQYILNETGPTGFIVKQDGSDKKFKVLLGDPHSCTCNQFKKDRELCHHILWILLKKFRVPKDNPMVYQLGLVEREIQEVLSGHLRTQSPKRSATSDNSSSEMNDSICGQRPISTDDTCPICQECLILEKHRQKRLIYCKYGCGNSVHLKCIKMWAEHQKSQNETIVTCPLCREKFLTFEELYDELHKKTKSSRVAVVKEVLHLGVTCSECNVCPIKGKCFKCGTCSNCFLCSNCFKTGSHPQHHPFLFKQNPDHIWRSVTRFGESSISSALPSQEIIDDIQSRELTENDYELLLNLDTTASSPGSGPSHSSGSSMIHILNKFHTEPLDRSHRLIRQNKSCNLCNQPYRRGEWVRRLPCEHRFHKNCIDAQLSCAENGTMHCPLDNTVIYKPQPEQNDRRPHPPRRSNSNNGGGQGVSSSPGDQPLNMLITGHGLLLRDHQTTKPVQMRTTGIIKKGTAMTRGGIEATGKEEGLTSSATPMETISKLAAYARKRKLAVKGNGNSLPQLIQSHDNNMTGGLNSTASSLLKSMQSHDNHVTRYGSQSFIENQTNDQLLLPQINPHVRINKTCN